jgi:apolipoprotein N-acyltransferase
VADPLRSFVSRHGDWLALPAGALLALAFAPTELFVVSFLCPALLFALWQGVAPGVAARRGWLFTVGTFLAGTYWIHHSVHLIGGAPLWLALFLMAGMSAILGTYSAAAGWFAARYLPRSGGLRWMAALPALWVLAEWLRGWVLSGFPWLALGYSQLDTSLAGFAPVAGVYGASLAAAVTGGALVTLAFGTRRSRLAAAIVLLLTWTGGSMLKKADWTRPLGAPVEVALVQGAVPQVMKWDAGMRQRTLELYWELSEPHWGTPLVVWPEAALPALANDLGDYLRPLQIRAGEAGSALIVGLIRRDPATGAYHNGLAAWPAPAGSGEQWYYKRRLVPFGEFFPVPAFVREWMRLMSLPYSDFVPGPDSPPPIRAAGQSLAPTICYEDAYGAEQLALARQATLLVNVSNDAWFGDSTAPHQHLEISRMRSLEVGRDALRATNDGITALIDARGRVTARIPQFQPGVLTGTVQPRTGDTPYARIGNWAVLLAALALLAAALLFGRRPLADEA